VRATSDTIDDLSIAHQRFAIVHGDMGVGGAEKQSLILGALLRDRGADVKVFAFEGPGPLSDLCRQAGLPFEVLDIDWRTKGRRLPMLARLAWGLRRWRPTVLLPYCDLPNIYCGAIWRLTGARLCVWNQRGVDIFLRNSRLGQIVLRHGRCILSNSAYRADYLARTYGIDAARIRVVPNAVDAPDVALDRGAFRRAHGLSDDHFVCVMVANFVERKGHALLLQAWGELPPSPGGKRPVLVLVGRKEAFFDTLVPTLDDLRQARAEVITLDYQTNVAEIVAGCDVAVFTSTTEGLPNAVLEAMALGKPVVAVADPSVLEALGESPQVARLLSPPGDHTALAERLTWAMEHPAELAEIGRENQRRAASRFSRSALLQGTLDCIAPFIGPKPRR